MLLVFEHWQDQSLRGKGALCSGKDVPWGSDEEYLC